jgi:hypothetical protein
MRKLTLFAALLFSSTLSFAQKGLEVGVEFTPAVTFILNDDDFAEGDNLNFRGTFGFNTGLSLGYNFNDGIGIASGILFSRQGQNYITDYAGVSKANQDVFARQLGYIRVPVLLKFNGDPTASSSSYFRVGPHLDLLNSARFTYDDRDAFNADIDQDLLALKSLTNQDLEVYKKLVVGLTLEMGGAVNMTDELKLVFMLHMSGSLTNPEADDIKDASDALLTRTFTAEPFGATKPYPVTSGGNRQTAWNVMGGFTVGFHYVLGFE